VFHADETTWWGYLVTAAVVAGGSKASIKLFHDLLQVKSTAQRQATAKSNRAVAKKKP
jgi:hypothetical protein